MKRVLSQKQFLTIFRSLLGQRYLQPTGISRSRDLYFLISVHDLNWNSNTYLHIDRGFDLIIVFNCRYNLCTSSIQGCTKQRRSTVLNYQINVRLLYPESMFSKRVL